jgi:hypothetical protein
MDKREAGWPVLVAAALMLTGRPSEAPAGEASIFDCRKVPRTVYRECFARPHPALYCDEGGCFTQAEAWCFSCQSMIEAPKIVLTCTPTKEECLGWRAQDTRTNPPPGPCLRMTPREVPAG